MMKHRSLIFMASIRRRHARIDALLFGDRGAVAILFAVCGSMMMVMLSVSLDYIQYGMVQARMQAALDVATLSAGADLAHYTSLTGASLTQWQADALAYYQANMPQGYINVNLLSSSFSATVTGDASTGQTIHLSATGNVSLIAPFTLASTTGSSGVGTTNYTGTTVTVSNTAIRQSQSLLELVMVLDNTGSMADSINGSTKMSGLQNAANTLVSDILGADPTNARIGLVPFASTVNVKNALSASGSWMSPVFTYNSKNVQMATDSSHVGWGGCPVEPRDANGYLYPKIYSPTDTSKFTPYYYNVPPASAGGLVLRTYSKYPTSSATYQQLICTSGLTTQTYTGVPVTVSNGLTNLCGYTGNAIGNGIGYYFDHNTNVSGGVSTTLTQNSDCITHPVTFLTNNSSTLTTAIKAMTADGSTVIPVGVLWGWRMLSSAWSQANSTSGWISSDTSYPKPETTTGLQRVMIVLTDGENNVGVQYLIPNDLYFNGLSGVGTNQLPAPTVYRTDGSTLINGSMDYTEAMPLPSNGVGYSNDINDFQLAACTAAKASGITIYSITFGSVSTTAQNTMQSCASPGDYYNAPDGATLNTIFQQIADHVGVLRLTQ